MKKLGQKLAASRPSPAQDLRERIDDAAAFYQALGGIAEVEEEGEKLIIKGYGCPLAEAVASHAGICVAMESLMSELLGVPVRQRCERGETASCRFEVDRG